MPRTQAAQSVKPIILKAERSDGRLRLENKKNANFHTARPSSFNKKIHPRKYNTGPE